MNYTDTSKVIDEFPNYSVTVNGKILKKDGQEKPQHKNRDGYQTVDLWKDGKKTCKSVHRLVATAFIPNPLNKPTINHIDGNKANNSIDNLEWNTYSENLQHAHKTHLRENTLTKEIQSKGGLSHRRPIRVKETGEIFPSLKDCCEALNLHKGAVSRCCSGISRSSHGYSFEYVDNEVTL